MLTLQEIYNKVKAHLLTQNARSSFNKRSLCAYRSPEGLKCAVGVLIEDEHYKGEIEGQSLNFYDPSQLPSLTNQLLLSGVDVNDINVYYLLRNLQLIHDTVDVIDWPKKLKKIAKMTGVEYK